MAWRHVGGLISALLIGTSAGCYSGAPEQAEGSEGPSSGDSSASAGEGGDADSGGDADGGGSMAEFEPGSPVLPRLTEAQYRNSIDDLLGPGLPTPALEPDTNPYLFFNIGAASTTLSEVGAQRYEEAADVISRAVFDDPARRESLVGCAPEAPGDACVAGFLASFGRRAYRRPLTEEELGRWLMIASELADGDAWRGLQLAVAGLLQSPHFLYRVELGEPDADDPDLRRFNGYEMASRLSFLLWNTTPDAPLLEAAERGDLLTDAGLLAEARRLLDDPRARPAIQGFFSQFLDLGRLSDIHRDPALFPLFTPTLPRSARTEIDLLVEDLIYRQGGDIRGLFSSRRTFVNSELAALYGVDAPGATAITFVPVELPADGPRAGMLTQAAFLMMNAHETETSPTRRGKYIRERVLCMTVPPPPDDVSTVIPEDGGEAKTLREKLEQHRADPTCAGCHAFIDPPGYLFEAFDEIGAFRTENRAGYTLDVSGDLDGVPLASARELATMLVDDVRVGRCMITQLHRHSSGRLEATTEVPALRALESEFESSGYRFRELLLAFVTSDLFRTVAAPEVE
jgi:hypothetical protein